MPFREPPKHLNLTRRETEIKARQNRVKLLIEHLRRNPQLYSVEARLIPKLKGVTGADFYYARSALKKEGVKMPILKKGARPVNAIKLGTQEADVMKIVYDELVTKKQRRTLAKLKAIIKERTGRDISEHSISAILSLMKRYMQIGVIGSKTKSVGKKGEEATELVKERTPKLPLSQLQPRMLIELTEEDRPLICIVLGRNIVKPLYREIGGKYLPIPKKKTPNERTSIPEKIVLSPNSRYNMVTLRE